VSRQAALLTALALLASAAALVSFGSWILLRRKPKGEPSGEQLPEGSSDAARRREIADGQGPP
jgi:hypothetical protein